MRVALLLLVWLVPPMVSAQTPMPEDIDGDFLLNVEEDKNQNGIVDPGETDPYDADTDGGGEGDGSEIQAGRDPLDKTDDFTYDRDGDGLTNGEEEILGTDPSQKDTDGDGINDNEDLYPLESEYIVDTDGDSLPDAFEEEHGLAPDNARDANGDIDNDDLSNKEEFEMGTNPSDPDTDRDGIDDGIEVENGMSPLESYCLVYSDPEVTFKDTAHHWSQQYVGHLHRIKILPEKWRLVSGYLYGADYHFDPDKPISRAELLKLALLSSCIHVEDIHTDRGLTFSDVPRTVQEGETANEELMRRVVYTGVQHDIVHGYPDGSFKPNETVNRVEALKMLIRATQLKPRANARLITAFRDVIPNEWYTHYVELALGYQLLQGHPDGFFRPADPMTRAEAAKLVYLFMLENPIVNGFDLPQE